MGRGLDLIQVNFNISVQCLGLKYKTISILYIGYI